jgi:hypothetical protein
MHEHVLQHLASQLEESRKASVSLRQAVQAAQVAVTGDPLAKGHVQVPEVRCTVVLLLVERRRDTFGSLRPRARVGDIAVVAPEQVRVAFHAPPCISAVRPYGALSVTDAVTQAQQDGKPGVYVLLLLAERGPPLGCSLCGTAPVARHDLGTPRGQNVRVQHDRQLSMRRQVGKARRRQVVVGEAEKRAHFALEGHVV